MQVEVDQAALAATLAVAAKATARKPAVPAYGAVRLDAGLPLGGGPPLRVVATDSELAIVAGVDGTAARAGTAVVVLERLGELVRTFSGGRVALQGDGQALRVKAGSFGAKLQALPTEDYPAVAEPDADAVSGDLPRADLLAALKRVQPCVGATGDYYLAGVYLDVAPDLCTCVACDGHRLAVATGARTGEAMPPAIVPRRAVEALVALLGGSKAETVRYSISERHLFFAADAWRLLSRTIDGRYPAWQRIVPPSFRVRATVAREPVMAALRRALLVAQGTKVVVAIGGGELVVSASSQDVGEAAERVPVREPEAALEFAANGTYLLSFLEVAEAEHVVLAGNDPRQALGLWSDGCKDPDGKDAAYRGVMMPIVI